MTQFWFLSEVMKPAAYFLSWALAVWAVVLVARIAFFSVKAASLEINIDIRDACLSLMCLVAISGLLLALAVL